MNDIIKDLELIPIKSVPLSESEVGKNINERFSNIDKNFQSIIDSEYLKGQTGDGIYIKECSFEKDSNVELGIYKDEQLLTSGKLYQLISECILTGVKYSDERILNGKIVLIYQNNEDKNILISSLPYVFIDRVYLGSLREENKPIPNKDLSCIIYFENNDFVKSSTIPKIYYNEDVAAFCWNINGVDTQLPAQGPKGDIGESGESVYYARCEYNQKKKEYQITHIYNASNDTFETNFVIKDGCIIVSEVTNATGDIPSVIIGVYNEKEDEENKIIKYIDQPIGLNIPDISTLMKGNPDNALYVNARANQGKNIYHSIYSVESSNSSYRDTLRIGLVEEDENGTLSELNTASEFVGKLISGYRDNHFNKNVTVDGKLISKNQDNEILASDYKGNVSLAIGTNPKDDGKKICVIVGQTSSTPFGVPFATNAEFIGSNSNTVGNYNQPVYICEGKPTAINIEGGTSDSENCLLTEARNAQNQIWSTTGITANYSKKTLTAEGGFIGNLQGTATNADKLGGKLASSFTSLKPMSIGDQVTTIEISNGSIVFVSGSVENYTWKWSSSIDLVSNSTDENISIIQFSINYPYKDEGAKNFKLSDRLTADDAITDPVKNLTWNFYYPTDSSTPNTGDNIRCEQIYTGYKTSNKIDFFVNTCYYQLGS